MIIESCTMLKIKAYYTKKFLNLEVTKIDILLRSYRLIPTIKIQINMYSIPIVIYNTNFPNDTSITSGSTKNGIIENGIVNNTGFRTLIK